MKTIAFVAAFVSFLPLAAADVAVTDNNETLTVDCAKDPNVSIMGNHTTMTLTGTCKKVSISGNHATVTGSANLVSISGNHNTAVLDGVDKLSTPGNHNTATWKKPIDAKLKKPKIGNSGNGNTITQTK
jgi:hypothetical protein